jgi:hypothetical protein
MNPALLDVLFAFTVRFRSLVGTLEVMAPERVKALATEGAPLGEAPNRWCLKQKRPSGKHTKSY